MNYSSQNVDQIKFFLLILGDIRQSSYRRERIMNAVIKKVIMREPWEKRRYESDIEPAVCWSW